MIYLFVGLHIYALTCNSKLHMSDDNYKTYIILSRGIRCFVFISFFLLFTNVSNHGYEFNKSYRKQVFSGIKLCVQVTDIK